MIGDLTVSAQATFNKLSYPRQSPFTVGETGTLISSGQYNVSGIVDVTGTGTGLDLGDVGTIGFVVFKNLRNSLIASADTPSVTQGGTPGSTHYSYAIVAFQADGAYNVASSAITTTTGAATLNGTNFNTVSWPAVDNAVSYDVYRTASSGTPNTTGKIGSTSALTFNDTGLAGDGSTAPSTTPFNFNTLISLDGGTNYYLRLFGGESHVFRPNSGIVTALWYKTEVSANETQMAYLVVSE